MRLVALAVLLAATPALAESGDSQIVASIAQCESGTAAACLDAATALEKVHAASRLGKTPHELREMAKQTWATQCAAGSGDACLEHGKLLFHAGDTTGTTEIEHGCTLGSGRACLYQAEHEKRPARALELFGQACDHGSAHGCEEVALHDPAHAGELHQKACDGGDGLGCQHAGEALRATDKTAAFDDFDKACDGEILDSCVAAGDLAPDPVKARELFARACDGSTAAGCSRLADLVAHGQGGDRNWGAGLDLAEKACTLAHAAKCPQLAELRAHPPDATCSTEDTCNKLCDERLGAACRTLGTIVPEMGRYDDGCKYGDAESCLLAGNADGVLLDATGTYERGCKLGNASACVYADVAHASAGSAAARESLRRRCAKTPATCALYGMALVDKEPARAETVWKTACAKGDGAACRLAAAQMIPQDHGYGVCGCDEGPPKSKAELAAEARAAKREAEGKTLYKRGCDLGDARACAYNAPYDQVLPPLPATTPAWE